MRKKPSIITNYCSMQIQKKYLEFSNGHSRFIYPEELDSSKKSLKETPKEIRKKWENL